MFASTKAFIHNRSSVSPFRVEVSVLDGTSSFELVGRPDSQAREMRERLHAALVNSGFRFPLFDHIVVNVPTWRGKLKPEIDLAIAAALLNASLQVTCIALSRMSFVSELALDGSTRPVAGIAEMIEQSRKRGDEMIVIPSGCAGERTYADGIAVVELESLSQLPTIAARHTQRLQGPPNKGRTIAEQFGLNLAEHRKRSGLTQRELARRTRMYDSDISVLEHGKRVTRVDTVVRLAEALSIEPGELFAKTRELGQ